MCLFTQKIFTLSSEKSLRGSWCSVSVGVGISWVEVGNAEWIHCQLTGFASITGELSREPKPRDHPHAHPSRSRPTKQARDGHGGGCSAHGPGPSRSGCCFLLAGVLWAGLHCSRRHRTRSVDGDGKLRFNHRKSGRPGP